MDFDNQLCPNLRMWKLFIPVSRQSVGMKIPQVDSIPNKYLSEINERAPNQVWKYKNILFRTVA